jgi:hypothetical protein
MKITVTVAALTTSAYVWLAFSEGAESDEFKGYKNLQECLDDCANGFKRDMEKCKASASYNQCVQDAKSMHELCVKTCKIDFHQD